MISTFIATGKLNEFFRYQSNKKKTRMDHSILLPFNTGGQVYCGVDGSRGFARLSSSSSFCRSSTAVGYWVNYYYFRYYTGHPENTNLVVGDKNILRSINCSFIFYTLYRETTLLCPLPLHPIVIIGSVAPFSFPISFV